MGRPEDGLAMYRAHAESSGNLEFNAMAAFLLAQQSKTEAARVELVPVVKSWHAGVPLNATTLSLVAFTDRRTGDLEQGLEAARLATELFRAEGNSRWLVMGRVSAGLLEELGRELEASMEYEGQLALSPDDAGTLSDFANFLAVRGKQVDKAYAYAKRALELKPGNAATLDTMGLALIKLGRVEEATETLVRAWRREPALTGVRAHLAQALGKGKVHTEGLGELIDALRTEPNRANTLEIEKLLVAVGL
jgi:tetratricopeptide (TPR) repeat protein